MDREKVRISKHGKYKQMYELFTWWIGSHIMEIDRGRAICSLLDLYFRKAVIISINVLK